MSPRPIIAPFRPGAEALGPRAPRAIALAVALAAGPAAAQHVAVRDLGRIDGLDACMARAEAAFVTYERKHGAGERDVADWIVYQWDLGGDRDLHAHIACLDAVEGGGGLVVGFLSVWAARDVARRERDRLGAYFDLD